MPFYIHKPDAPQRTFILNRTLHLTAEGKVVEESDPQGKRVLGVRGSSLFEAEAQAYGLDDSYRINPPQVEPEPQPEPQPEPPPEPKKVKALKKESQDGDK